MTEPDIRAAGDAAAEPAPSAPATAGVLLRQAREAAGLTIDGVAQQLKLAPRQIRALEDGDFAGLPGRTFVRGFVRNYARLLRIDPDPVVAALPGTASTPTLEAPTLHPTAPSIGELPTSEGNRPGWTRWAIPLTLAAIVAAAAVYEWLRPGLDPRQTAPQETAVAPAGAAAPTVPAMSRNADTPLPNPMAAGTAPAPAAASSTVAEPASRPATAPAAAATPSVAVPPSAKPQAAIATPGKSAASVVSPAAPPATDATLALTFRDYSWVEVKDRNGQTLLSRMNAGGTSESISGAPPFEVVIGNASDVRVTFRGKVVDLAPHTRQNIARLTLP